MKSNKSTPNQVKHRVTQADLARLAGVSPGVVSAALHNGAKGKIRVSPAVVKKIKELAKQEGYVPNYAARQLVAKRSKVWGVLCSSIPSELTYLRLSLLNEAAKKMGYRLVIEYTDGTRPILEANMELFHSLGAEGIVCLTHYFPNNHTLVPQMLSTEFDRVVFVDKPEMAKGHFCEVDYVEAGRMHYRALLQNGKIPGLVLRTTSWYAGPLMAEGFTEEWSRDNSPLPEAPVWVAHEPDNDTTFTIADAHRAVKWARSKGITGLAVSTDEGAAFICNAIFEQGIRVPQNIAVIGTGNSHFCEMIYPPLSSMDLQPRNNINALAEMLHQLCENNPVEPAALIQPLLQARASCPSKAADPMP